GGAYRVLRASRARAGRFWLVHGSRHAAQRDTESALNVRAHGGDGAGKPHLAGDRQGAGASAGRAAPAALVMPRLPLSHAAPKITRHGHRECRRENGIALAGSDGGSNMLKLGARVGAGLMCVAAIGLLSATMTWAQDKELSDKSVR